MPKYQLMYFDGRGRAELSRWIFVAAGKEYEDIRLKKEEWPAKKPDTPFGQLPVLIIDGEFKLAQSNAIARFLGKRFGFLGKDDLEEAKCDMVLQCVEDFVQAMMKILFGDDAAKAAAKEKWDGGLRDEYLVKFEKLLVSNKGGDGFFVGDGITIADMAFCITISYLTQRGFDQWDKYPKIAALRNRVEKDNQKIANWIATRPPSEF